MDGDDFDRFFEEQKKKEPETLRKLIADWEVVESRGTSEHRLLLLKNAQGEKRILKMFSHQQNARMRAEREALDNAREKGIPRLFDYAEDDQYVYLLREYVEGENLAERIARTGRMDIREAAQIGCQLCDVLERLHRRNIIHRDVKPENVIIRPDGCVFLIDFDISRKYTEGVTHDTECLGTRAIAPPEQYGYGQTDRRADLYSLGVVLLFLGTGSYDLRKINMLPRLYGQIVRHCTYFDPRMRYQSALQVSRRLRLVVHRKRWIIGLAAILTLLLGVSIGMMLLRPGDRVYPSLLTMAANDPVTFQEPLIEACVRAQLGLDSSAPLTYAEVSAVTELYIYGNYTNGQAYDPDYRGDKVFINDHQLGSGTVESLHDLLMMPSLRVLRLYRQPLSNVDELAALTKLEELSLDESPNISDLSAISTLEWLRLLDIGDTAVSDLSPLQGCPRLRQINLERIPCDNFSVLSRYAYLEYLNVNNASPDAVMAAVSGKMIDFLWLDYAGLTSIEPFARAESVRQLHAKHNNIRSLAGIETLTMLVYVDVAYNPIEDLTPLLALPRLKALRIDPSMNAAWEAIREKATFNVEWEN